MVIWNDFIGSNSITDAFFSEGLPSYNIRLDELLRKGMNALHLQFIVCHWGKKQNSPNELTLELLIGLFFEAI